jgi:tripartite-type tricarboxylate transporter receptor subunit TctC
MRNGILLALINASLAGAFVAASGTAMAQDYPSATVKIVVPFVAGGGVDVVARLVTPRLAEELGQSVIIENRGGAGGMLGAAAVAAAPPDGYTLLFGTGSTHGTNSSVYSRLGYDPVKDFVPIVLVSTSPLLLVAPASLPAQSTGELIALARKAPGELRFASYGTGSINHLGAELFNSMAHISASHIPYRGSAPALADLIGGRIDYMFDGVSTSLGYIESGSIRVLGVAGPRRTPVLPQVPTIAETALAGFDTTVWFGLFAPAGATQAVVYKVNAAANAVLGSPPVRESFAKLGIEAAGGTTEVLAARVQAEMGKWADLVRARNIHLER